MDEVDKIVLLNLRQISSIDDDDEITSLTQLTPEMIVKAVAQCLKLIDPGRNQSLPDNLPQNSMAQRYAVTQQLAEAIKTAGFRGDCGYQTLLYCNTVEVRRVLMFLVERLPKDGMAAGASAADIEDTVSQKLHEISSNMRTQLRSPWVPEFCRRTGSYKAGNAATGKNFVPKRVSVPFVTQRDVTEEIKEYWRRHAPSVFQQTDKSNLLPSIVDANDRYTSAVSPSVSFDSLKAASTTSVGAVDGQTSAAPVVPTERLSDLIKNSSDVPDKPNEIQELNQRIEELQTEVEAQIHRMHEAGDGMDQIEESLQSATAEMDVVEREKLTEDRLEMLLEDPESNSQRLEERVESLEHKMTRLQEQWAEVQAPVLEQLKEAQRLYDEKDKRVLLDIQRVQETYDALAEELHAKILLHSSLVRDLQQVDQTNERTAFTSRILDIINNIKKQDRDIGLVLRDTRKLQKEINTIGGQLDRQFSVTDDLIFQCAKQDENAKRAYKLLATLHADLGGVVDLVTETGVVIREVREIEEQIDMERSKNVAANLSQIQSDLAAIRQQQ